MKTFIKLQFNSEGDPPLEIIKKLKEAGFTPVVGEQDFAVIYESPEEYGRLITKLHETLRGHKVSYTLTSHGD